MDLITISLAVILLATLVLAFLAAKTWHWAHVLVVVGLAFSSLGYVMLLTPSMRERIKWQKQFVEAEAKLQQQLPLVNAIQRGTSDAALLRQLVNAGLEGPGEGEAEEIDGVWTLTEKVRVANRLRGRLWIDAVPDAPDAATGEVTVSIDNPNPLGIDEGALLFVFEQGAPSPNSPANGAQYLGEFRVTGLGEQQVTLAPVLKLDQQQAERLLNSRGPWILHETMPVDDQRLFVDLSEDQLRELIPEEVIEEYLREGTSWTDDDGEETKRGFNDDDLEVGPDDWDQAVRFVYQRQLRDYSAEFQQLASERIQLLADIQALEADNAKVATALKGAQQVVKLREEHGGNLRHDREGTLRDLQAVEKYLAALQRQVNKAERLLAQTLAANEELADKLTATQQAAAGRDLQANPQPSRGAVDVDAL